MHDGQETIVITGVGLVTAAGVGKEAVWTTVCEGRSVVRTVESFNTSRCPTRVAAELPPEVLARCATVLSEREQRESELFSQVGLLACDLALEDAGEGTLEVPPERVGVIIGNCVGALRWIEEVIQDTLAQAVLPRLSQLAAIKFMPNAASALIGIHYGLAGPNLVVSTACSAGAYAIAYGMDLLRSGRVDVAICGGTEIVVTEIALRAFSNLTALSRRNDTPETACRPFDWSRDGTVLGDGAGVVILERARRAERRGATPYARLLGYGLNCEGYSFVSPRPDASGMEESMRLALAESGLAPAAVDYVNAHGTATRTNDALESKAIGNVLGPHADRVCVSSQKGALGHLIGAAGAVEAGITAMAVQRECVPPTVNFKEAGSDCPLNYVPERPEHRRVSVALSNSFALGGHNCTLAFGRA